MDSFLCVDFKQDRPSQKRRQKRINTKLGCVHLSVHFWGFCVFYSLSFKCQCVINKRYLRLVHQPHRQSTLLKGKLLHLINY